MDADLIQPFLWKRLLQPLNDRSRINSNEVVAAEDTSFDLRVKMIKFSKDKVKPYGALVPVVLSREKGVHAVVGVDIGIADIALLIVIGAAAKIRLHFILANALLGDIGEKALFLLVPVDLNESLVFLIFRHKGTEESDDLAHELSGDLRQSRGKPGSDLRKIYYIVFWGDKLALLHLAKLIDPAVAGGNHADDLNHIYYNSTAYDRSRKFRNFIGSSFALRRLSDRVCLEHDLSVIANPKLHSKGRYLHYGQWLGENQKLSQKEQIRLAIDAALTERPKDFADFLRRMETAGIQVKRGRGGAISFLVPGQQRAARFRAATLGDGYGPEDVQAVIDGKAPTRKTPARRAPAPRRVNLLIDIQERMRQGKGPAYERWAKVYNLKQMAAALQYLKEHRLFEYDDLAAKTDAATERFHTLAGDIQQTEAELSRVSDLMAAVVQYAKTRPAFDGYKAAKYSRKYLAEHEAELADYRAAKATMAELLGGEKLPKMDVLKEKRRQLAARKKALYLEYRKAQQDMRELVAVKGSVDHLRGLTDNQRNKEQAR